jgi:hypothetical protein
MRILVLLLAVQVSVPALAQTASKPVDAPVTFAELEGSSIEVRIVRQQVIRRDGHTFPVRVHSNLKLTADSDDKLDYTWSSVFDTPRGVRKGKTLSQ